jgi:hypothetical protein
VIKKTRRSNTARKSGAGTAVGYKEYELLVANILRGISKLDGLKKSEVQHNIQMKGISGAVHQIDVYWEFEIGPITYKTVVQAKDQGKRIDFPTVNTFKGVLDDLVGRPRGMMVTRKGYDTGNIQKIADSYGISLFIVDDYRGAPKHVGPSLPFSLVGEEVTVQLLAARTAVPYSTKVMEDISRRFNTDALTYKGTQTGKVYSADNLKTTVVLEAFKAGIGTPEGQKFEYKLPEPLIVWMDSVTRLDLIALNAMISTKEISRLKTKAFVTHLVQSATGETKYEVDNLFRVYPKDNPGV